jgi:hypothetical protein
MRLALFGSVCKGLLKSDWAVAFSCVPRAPGPVRIAGLEELAW